MLKAFLLILLMGACCALSWIIGVICTLWTIETKHPRIYAALVTERKRGGKDGISA